jgi:hypothetical protein
MHTKEREHLGDLGVNSKDKLKYTEEKQGVKM